MRPLPLLWTLLLLGLSSSLSEDLPPREPRAVEAPEVVFAAEFAVGELQKLSDSGIYHSLSLRSIRAASSQEGVFHHNTFLTLELACPHFKSGHDAETYDVMVMRHLEDGTFSFAIDEFPEMDEDAIETFWIEKVEQHRRYREETFRQMELDIAEHQSGEGTAAAVASADELAGMTAEGLLHVLSHDTDASRREAALDVIEGRWEQAGKEEHDELSHMKTSMLHEIASNPTVAEQRKLAAEDIIKARVRLLDSTARSEL